MDGAVSNSEEILMVTPAVPATEDSSKDQQALLNPIPHTHDKCCSISVLL
jgi:hypothetical protein